MGIILTDEPEENLRFRIGGSIVIGKVEFLPMPLPEKPKHTLPAVRQISRAALDKYATGKTARESADFAPSIATVALCAHCAGNFRLGHSTMCAACIRRLSGKNQTVKFLDMEREMTARDFWAMCVLCGLLVLAVIKFAAPEARHTETRQPVSKEAGITTARKF